MDMLEELKAKEAELTGELKSLQDQLGKLQAQFRRASVDLSMVQHGMRLLGAPSMKGHRKWTVERLAQANAMHDQGMTWAEVAQEMGVKLDTLHTAITRARQKKERSTV